MAKRFVRDRPDRTFLKNLKKDSSFCKMTVSKTGLSHEMTITVNSIPFRSSTETPEEQPLAAWLNEARDGDSRKLALVFDHLRSALRVEATPQTTGRINARIDPDDVLQQAWLVVSRSFDTFRGQSVGEFVNWCKQITRHCLLKEIEKHTQAQKRAINREVPGSGPLHTEAGRLTSPSQKAIRRESQEAIEQAVTRLPTELQEVIRRRFLEGQSQKDIADALGITVQEAAIRVYNGLKELRQLLGDSIM